MFESISFLFLSALAVTAWSVLCYLDLIQQHKRLADYQVELYTEHPGLTHVPQYCPKEISKEKSIPNHAYDLLINLGFILGGCFTLYKLLRWLELQTIWNSHHEVSRAAIKVSLPALEHKKEEQKKEDHKKQDNKKEEHKDVQHKEPGPKEESVELKDQLNVLQGRYLEMQELLRELHASNGSSSHHETNSNTSTSSDAEADIITWKQPISSNSVVSTSSSSSDISASLSVTRRGPLAQEVIPTPPPPPPPPTTQNVFITNSHIHINGRVYISQKNVNIDLCRQATMYTRKQSEFLQVWDKYISGPKERPMIAGVRCNNILM